MPPIVASSFREKVLIRGNADESLKEQMSFCSSKHHLSLSYFFREKLVKFEVLFTCRDGCAREVYLDLLTINVWFDQVSLLICCMVKHTYSAEASLTPNLPFKTQLDIKQPKNHLFSLFLHFFPIQFDFNLFHSRFCSGKKGGINMA